MSLEKFWVLLSKKLSGEASESELQELSDLITAHPEWQYAVQNLTDLWKQQPAKEDIEAEDAYLLHLHRLKELDINLDDPAADNNTAIPQRRIKRWVWAAAATLVLGISGLFLSGKLSGRSSGTMAKAEVNEVSTRKGSKSEIKLPDGTVVWLNSGSKLTYSAKEYGQQLREVNLTGEGYFDVVKMKDKPFLIHTSNIDIKVLGTTFNVKAYPEDKQTETSLIRGSIEVTIKNRANNKIILSPNEKLIVENELFLKTQAEKYHTKYTPPTIAVNKLKYSLADSSVAETQWVVNKLVFNDESFAEVVIRMERWYNVDIELHDEVLEQMRMTGNFEKETIDQALEALKLTIPFKHEQTDNKIIIYR